MAHPIYGHIDLNRPVWEPVPRMCGGSFGWVRHRFPIKGGITSRQVLFSDSIQRGSYFAKWDVHKIEQHARNHLEMF